MRPPPSAPSRMTPFGAGNGQTAHREDEGRHRDDVRQHAPEPLEVREACADGQRRVCRVGHADHHPPLCVGVQTLRFGGRTRTAPDRSHPLPGVAPMKSTTTRASCSPRSSCRKCPAPSMVVCGRPVAPGMSALEDPVAAGGDRVRVAERGQERLVPTAQDLPRLPVRAPTRGRRGWSGTSIGNCRAPSL